MAGIGQTGSALELLREDIAVRVLDRHGSPLSGVNVTFAVIQGDGTLSAEQATSDALGVARVRWMLGPRTGPQQIRASLAGTRPAEVSITATARPQLLLSRHGASIEVVNVDNGERKHLFSQWVAMDAVWSPDGRRIAFIGRPDNTVPDGIYVMNADGSGVTRITNPGPGWDDSVDWSPDGKQLAFTRTEGGQQRIYVIKPDGSGLTQLTNSQSRHPRWSPDGAKIAFSQQSASHWSYEIAVMNADGTGVHYLTNNLTDDEEPDWSPDGSSLAYQGWRLGRPRLFVINADGTDDRLLTTSVPEDHLSDVSPAWSQDGSKIAFSRAISLPLPDGTSSYGATVYSIQPDGTGLTIITAEAHGALVRPRWRP
jgi:Tol biopolymer transport system component